ncbi:MAG: CPXCG motif-containing cysteine-rich protein [Gammaproteobacteria bacterium]|nr:CPXCG motif-containing cysteine-rich protein [Gammaproteobacteria bacterium]MDH3506874.1 CPXCG motif-containing cysteine-rich protein [Gammaproteobacteria bacterium]
MLPSEVIECPYCGEPIDLVIDDSVDHQQYVEDCSVCCRPINVDVSVAEDSEIHVRCWTDSEA